MDLPSHSGLYLTHELFGTPEYSDKLVNVSGTLFENGNWPVVCDLVYRSFTTTSRKARLRRASLLRCLTPALLTPALLTPTIPTPALLRLRHTTEGWLMSRKVYSIGTP